MADERPGWHFNDAVDRWFCDEHGDDACSICRQAPEHDSESRRAPERVDERDVSDLGSPPADKGIGHCPACGVAVGAGAFCSSCGSSLAAQPARQTTTRCPAGHEVDLQSKFCTQCGATVEAVMSPPHGLTDPTNLRGPGPYVSVSPPATAPTWVPASRIPTRTSGLAVASLVLGIIWFLGIGSLLAVVFAFISLRRIGRADGALGGRGLAIAGLVLGFVGFAMTVLMVFITVPTFLGARARAQDRVAQSSLRNTVTAAKALYTDNATYFGVDGPDLSELEYSLTFVPGYGFSTSPTEVSVATPTAREFVAATLGVTGTCWFMRDDAFTGSSWNKRDDGASECRALDAPGSGWSSFPSSAGD